MKAFLKIGYVLKSDEKFLNCYLFVDKNQNKNGMLSQIKVIQFYTDS